MGVPVITLLGDRHAGRMTASVLSTLSLSDWIARSQREYLDAAARWAGDPNALARIRSELRPRMRGSRLCDGKAWTHDLEAAYRAMWRRWCGQGS
jgi:predicted O-linked N-acetylglucosamine transferase (SPINDLY family)